MRKVVKYVIIDILRSKMILGYTLLLFLMSYSVFSLEDNVAKGLLTLLNLELFIIPLVSIIFSTIYIYNSSEFIELLVSQPLKRKSIWLSLFTGLSTSLVVAFLIGCGLPIIFFEPTLTGVIMILTGSLLSVIFVTIALFVSVFMRDKTKGTGMAIFIWLYFAIMFDGFVLFLLFQFSDYPLEKPLMAIGFLNPIDMSRILILLRLDVSALMGYTGAVFRNFFGAPAGISIAMLSLIIWIAAPLYFSLNVFKKKDL